MRIPWNSVYRLNLKFKVFKNYCEKCILAREKHSGSLAKKAQEGHSDDSYWMQPKFVKKKPEYDWDYITDPKNTDEIHTNIQNRKGVGDIYKVLDLHKKYVNMKSLLSCGESELLSLERELHKAASDIPNKTHPQVPIGDESCSRLIETVGEKREFDFPVRSAVKVGSILDALRTENLGESAGHRTYFFKGAFAQLQSALVRYSVDTLLSKGFQLVTVPELVHPDVIEGCGFSVHGDRTQVYRVETGGGEQVCLAGTGEIPLAGLLSGQIFREADMPRKLCTISRCYRAETSNAEDEKGIYRVHQFTKVEMFGVTSATRSTEADEVVQEFLDIQKQLFSALGLHFRILEMSSHELGSPAYRKFDMEAWMPEKQFWGEISSTSHCSDFQSRRLGIKYLTEGDSQLYTHTVNGTACAVPRLIMAIAENFQTKHGLIEVPEVLQPYLGGVKVLKPPTPPFKAVFMSPSREYRRFIEDS